MHPFLIFTLINCGLTILTGGLFGGYVDQADNYNSQNNFLNATTCTVLGYQTTLDTCFVRKVPYNCYQLRQTYQTSYPNLTQKTVVLDDAYEASVINYQLNEPVGSEMNCFINKCSKWISGPCDWEKDMNMTLWTFHFDHDDSHYYSAFIAFVALISAWWFFWIIWLVVMCRCPHEFIVGMGLQN